MGGLKVFSEIIGYTYTALWSFSNFPQIWTNYQRKSVAGFSVEFQALNTIGFTFYCIYVSFGAYFQHHWNLTKSIVIQDLLFAGICSFSVYILFFQMFFLYRRTITGTIHVFYRFVMFGLLTLAVYNVFLGIAGKLPWFSKDEGAYAYSVIQYLGFGKSFISFIKYVPQVYLNFIRKTTRGYNIANVLMDLGGGTCSFIQMVVNGYITRKDDGSPDFSHIYSNVPKLILSLESIFFDLILILQYFIYKENTDRIAAEEQSKLDQGLLILDPEHDFQDGYSSGNINNGQFVRIM